MTQADILVRKTAGGLKDVEQAVREHLYVRAFRDGRASVEALVPFIGHQYRILKADCRSASQLLQRVEGEEMGDFARRFLQGGLAARERLPAMAREIGLSEADLQAYEPSSEGVAYGAYISLLFNQGTAAEIMCALLVNLPTWRGNCRVLGRALRETYGWPSEATALLDGFAAIPSFDTEALPVIQAGLNRNESPNAIARAARLVQGYERMFWDAITAEAGQALAENRPRLKLSA